MPPFTRRIAFAITALLAIAGAGCAGDPAAADPQLQDSAIGAATTQAASSTTSEAATSTTATTTTTSTTTTTTTTLPPITLGFAGDTSFTHGLSGRDPLGDIEDLLSGPDFMVVNLETTVAEPDVGTPFPKRFIFKSPPESVELLTEAGIDFVQLANNHTLDYGRPALLRTLELLDEGNLPHVGAGTDPEAAYAPVVVDVEGWKIAFVAFSRVPCDWSASGENTRPEVAWTCPAFEREAALSVAGAAATDADLVIVLVHWGIEGDHCPQQYQWDLASQWNELGADFVVGGHPHVLQGVARLGDGWLILSNGNFAFPSARSGSSYTALFEFGVDSDGSSSLTAHPVRIVDGRPRPASDGERSEILDGLSRWSFGLDFTEDGAAVPSETAGACG
jgi:poly-gamma-glutamate synthesis protein (capsule biosynthesis protein)